MSRIIFEDLNQPQPTEHKILIERGKPGAKLKPDNIKKKERIAIYMTEEQKEIINRKAHENYQSISNYILARALK